MIGNPFTALERGLWHALKSCSLVTDLVRPGNMVNLTEDETPDPRREDALDDDFPRIGILPQGGAFNPVRASDIRSVRQRYVVACKTRHITTSNDEGLNKLKWAVFVAIERAASSPDLGFGLPEGLSINLQEFTDRLSEDELEQMQQRGWNVGFGVDAVLKFNLAEVMTAT